MAAEPAVPDGGALQQFVEDFASTLMAAGVSRMPARVFSCLLVSEQGRLTAAELAERLQTSPASISSAVTFLDAVRLVRRTREPGSRRDLYVVEHDVWYEATAKKDQVMDSWIALLDAAIGLVGEDTPAGDRLAESRDFFRFVRDEMESLLVRWAERKSLRSTAS